MQLLVLVMSQETVLPSLLALFCVLSDLICVPRCPLPRDWTPQPHPLSITCLFSCAQYTVYRDIHFPNIPLTMIGIPMLSWFISKPNVDSGNAIIPSILFPVKSDGINCYLKYWGPFPMISHIILCMISSSCISGCTS